MADLLYCEILKCKRSKMFLLSLLGTIPAPLMSFVSYIQMKIERPEKIVTMEIMFSNTNLYITLLIGMLLYSVIASYLFSREYTENTLKSILTIPINKTRLLLTKFIMLFLWVMTLTITAWALVLIFCLIGGSEEQSLNIMLVAFGEYILGGLLLFLGLTPIVFITLLYKNLIPAIIAAASITMVNIAISNSEHRAIWPWAAIDVIASGTVIPEYSILVSYIAVIGTCVIGFVASIIYFKNKDV